MRRGWAALLCAALLGGCGSSGEDGPEAPEIGAAKTFELVGFDGASPRPGQEQRFEFHIEQPEGGPLTRFKTGGGPHTGVHLIAVSEDLEHIIHRHPQPQGEGTFVQPLAFPAPGRWRVVADAYPDLGANTIQNFQLTADVRVAGPRPKPSLGAFEPVQSANGATFTMEDPGRIEALKPEFVDVDVRGPDGRPARFSPYFGAVAHAIFFRERDLTYFHTHVCGAIADCTSGVGGGGGAAGSRPGRLRVGMLLPSAGTWRLFLQARVDGKVTTVPYTLRVQ